MLHLDIAKEFKGGSKNFRLELKLEICADFRRVVFFGPSGSGKTLALRMIAGLQKPDYGRIEVLDTLFYDSGKKFFLAPQKRHSGYLVQDYALFPHLTILQNVAYPGTGFFPRRVSASEAARAGEILERFGIAHLQNHLPGEISGGQKQRCALARAFNSSPKFLLLDEPFSALDPLMRLHMRDEINSLLSEMDLPAIIITHDPEDVVTFAGALVLFKEGHGEVISAWPELRAKYATAALALHALLTDESATFAN